MGGISWIDRVSFAQLLEAALGVTPQPMRRESYVPCRGGATSAFSSLAEWAAKAHGCAAGFVSDHEGLPLHEWGDARGFQALAPIIVAPLERGDHPVSLGDVFVAIGLPDEVVLYLVPAETPRGVFCLGLFCPTVVAREDIRGIREAFRSSLLAAAEFALP